MPEPEELLRSKSPLKILTEQDVTSMLEHGELPAASDEEAEILKQSFLNPERAREHAPRIYEEMRKKGLFVASPTGNIFATSGSGERFKDMLESLEMVASAFSHEYIHTIFDKMKKLRAASDLDKRAAKLASLAPASNLQELDIIMSESQLRLSERPITPIDSAIQKYRREGSY